MRHLIAGALCAGALVLPTSVPAQIRGFVIRLGVDTFAVERFVRKGDTVQGAVVRHTPTTTVLRYTLTFNPDSSIASYRESILEPDGTPAPNTPQGVAQTDMKMTFVGDSVIRELTRNGTPLVLRNAAPGVTLPAVGGTSPYWQELALQAMKRRGVTGFGFYSFAPGQDAPNTFQTRSVASDSAEVLFPQGFKRGYKLDREGQLVHMDGSNTTVRLQATPIRDADIDAIARAWGAAEAAGHGMGVPSSRDTLSAMLGDAHVSIDYGRPAKRGRKIWGGLVPLDTVWRLGANLPTVLTTDRDVTIGETRIPAGSYSLWLVPSRSRPTLLVNKQIQGWVGVPMHDAAQDVASIPVRAHRGKPAGEERFRMLVQSGKLLMLWDDGGYEVPVR